MPTLSGFRENKKNIPSSNNVLPRKNASPGTVSNSFAAVLKSGPVNHNTVTESSPAIVLDDACIMERDFSCSLMGKMKDINALSNLFIILANEGFENVKLFYLGGQWVLLELDSVTSKEKITNHVGVGSWFEVLKPACNSFVCEERLVWVAIEGLPVKALTRNTYAKIIASWGELVDINESDNCSLSCIRVCVRTKPRVLINDRVKIIIKGQLHWICVKEQEAWMPEFKTVMEDDTSSDEESEGNNENDRGSDNEHVSETSFAHENVDEFQVNPKPSCNTVISEDPFGIYKILKRNKDANVTEGDTHTPQYPLGFTPNVKENIVDNIFGNASQPKPNPTTSGNKEKATSVNDKFQASGSILKVMDELIKVAQTMGLGNNAKKGWIQELNTKHSANFVDLQETKMEKMDLFSIKALWGNLSFDYAFSPSIGYSGGILCVWDPRLFVKDNSTVSDSFLAISGSYQKKDVMGLYSSFDRFLGWRMCPLRYGSNPRRSNNSLGGAIEGDGNIPRFIFLLDVTLRLLLLIPKSQEAKMVIRDFLSTASAEGNLSHRKCFRKGEGLPTWLLYNWDGLVGWMKERSGFAGKKVWDDIPVVTGFVGRERRLLGK
ncbi:hypothetical protein Tco_0010803 [Tanacetum coccineum]